MLTINPIKNVNSTPNISFGYRSNELLQAPQADMVTGGLFTGFVGTLKSSPLFSFNQTVEKRAKSISEGLDNTKLNYIA